MVKWSKHFFPRQGYYFFLKEEEPDYDFLSEREIQALQRAAETIVDLEKQHGQTKEILHKRWPEWKDLTACGKKSLPLPMDEVLSELFEDESEVRSIAEDIRAFGSAKAALQVDS